MVGMGKDVGADTLARASFAAASGASATATGQAIDITGLGARANGLRGVVGAVANLDAGDSLSVTTIKLQSSADSAFTTPVDQVAGADISLVGAAGDVDVDYRGESYLDLDLTRLPAGHSFVRLVATHALSDAVNTTGAVFGVLIFGGLDEAPGA